MRRASERMLEAVDRQIAELITTRDQMLRMLRLSGQKLAGTSDDQPAYLLERWARAIGSGTKVALT